MSAHCESISVDPAMIPCFVHSRIVRERAGYSLNVPQELAEPTRLKSFAAMWVFLPLESHTYSEDPSLKGGAASIEVSRMS
jgi:hypothetical protein